MIDIDLNEAIQTIVLNLQNGAQKSTFNPNEELSNCAYRGANGAKCFIGMLIDDEDYQRSWDEDGITAKDLLMGKNIINLYGPLDDEGNQKAFIALQNIHDTEYNWDRCFETNVTSFNERGWEELKQWCQDSFVEWPDV